MGVLVFSWKGKQHVTETLFCVILRIHPAPLEVIQIPCHPFQSSTRRLTKGHSENLYAQWNTSLKIDFAYLCNKWTNGLRLGNSSFQLISNLTLIYSIKKDGQPGRCLEVLKLSLLSHCVHNLSRWKHIRTKKTQSELTIRRGLLIIHKTICEPPKT
jgi:hypothetical protein